MEKTYKITLPKGVSVDNIETNVKDGVLSVSVEMVKDRDLPRWRALYNEKYYVINSETNICYQKETGHVVDGNRYDVGNYFRTREAAEKVAKQIREIIKNSKAE